MLGCAPPSRPMAPRADGHALRPPALQMITIALSPEQPLGRCRLIHHGSWAAFVAALPPSVSMLELNSFAAQMVLGSREHAVRYRRTHDRHTSLAIAGRGLHARGIKLRG